MHRKQPNTNTQIYTTQQYKISNNGILENIFFTSSKFVVVYAHCVRIKKSFTKRLLSWGECLLCPKWTRVSLYAWALSTCRPF
eukprot:m.348479 g.348479  ORF g.348479 m.348479 type:complete len:83 (+) comp37456_c0_seq1:248-496(+)